MVNCEWWLPTDNSFREPTSRLLEMSRFCNFVSFESEMGNVPLILFLDRSNEVKFFRNNNSRGMEPLILLLEMIRLFKWVRFPNKGGISPSREF